MSGFYARYVVVAALGAAGVWFGVPELKPLLEQQRSVEGAEAAPATPAPAPAAPWRPADARSQTPAVVPVDRTDPSDRSDPSDPAEPVAVPAPEPAPEPAPVAQPTGPVYDWGVLADTTNCYTAAGQPNGKMPGGTVVERVSVHESSLGSMVRCRVLHNQMWREGFFIPAPALVMFQGSYVNAPAKNRDQIVRYFTLRSMIADRRAELKDHAIRANPHFRAYQSAAIAMTEFQTKAKELVVQRDKATGTERSRLDDTLRRLKSEESTLLHNFRKAEEPYKRWRAQNDDGSIAVAADAQINAWESELTAMEPEVRGLVGGL
jgi:hypothetical protein